MRTAALGTLLVLALGAAACGPPEPPPTYAEVQEVFIAAGCTACHQGPGTSPGLSLLPGQSHASLVDQPARSSAWNGTAWAGGRIVVPGEPDASLLMVVLKQPSGLPGALRMPNGARISAARLALLERWIAAGAEGE